MYLHDDGSHGSFPCFIPHIGVCKRTSERTSKESVSFNHAGTGKLNYPGGWLATRTPDMERVERKERKEGRKRKNRKKKNGRAQADGCGFIEESFIEQIR